MDVQDINPSLAVLLLPVVAIAVRPNAASVSPWQVVSESVSSWFTYDARREWASRGQVF